MNVKNFFLLDSQKTGLENLCVLKESRILLYTKCFSKQPPDTNWQCPLSIGASLCKWRFFFTTPHDTHWQSMFVGVLWQYSLHILLSIGEVLTLQGLELCQNCARTLHNCVKTVSELCKTTQRNCAKCTVPAQLSHFLHSYAQLCTVLAASYML